MEVQPFDDDIALRLKFLCKRLSRASQSVGAQVLMHDGIFVCEALLYDGHRNIVVVFNAASSSCMATLTSLRPFHGVYTLTVGLFTAGKEQTTCVV